jgi:hypothetical protein
MTELTATAKKIMELFQYVRIKQGDILSFKLFQARKHLWKDLEQEEVLDALRELIQKGLVEETQDPAGWRLLEGGEQYIRSLKR